MLFNAWKGILRRPILTVICLLLLIFSLLLPLLGASMSSAVNPLRALNKEYTEIAVIYPQLAYNNSEFAQPTRELYEGILEDGILLNHTLGIDTRTFAGAYSPDLEPISFDFDIYDQASSWLYGQRRGVLVATCTGVETTTNTRKGTYTHQYTFDVDQVVYHHESVLAEKLKTFSTSYSISINDENCGPYVEVGKTYLCWGNFEYTEGVLSFGFVWNWIWGNSMKWIEQNGSHAIYYVNDAEVCPYVSELNEPLETFWNTEVGQIWQRTVFGSIDIHAHSVTLVGTDCLESIYAFNSGDAAVTEGDMFAEEQYETGEKVCIVSRELAEKNGLQVGESLSLSLYESQYPYSNPNTSVTYTEGDRSQVGYTDTGEWRIVGIYEHEYTPGVEYDMNPNLIFVPKKSANVEYEVANYDYPDLYLSILLPRGGIEQFKLDAEAEGYLGWFWYGDNGRTEDEQETQGLQRAIDAWQSAVDAWSVSLYAVALLLLFGATMLYYLSKKKEIGALYTIETSQNTLLLHFLLQFVMLIAVSAGLVYVSNLLFIPPLARQILTASASKEFADVLVTMLPDRIIGELSVMLRSICISFVVSAVLAWVAAKRKYQFEYHEKEGSQ